MTESLELDRAFETLGRKRNNPRSASVARQAAASRSNFIDQRLFAVKPDNDAE